MLIPVLLFASQLVASAQPTDDCSKFDATSGGACVQVVPVVLAKKKDPKATLHVTPLGLTPPLTPFRPSILAWAWLTVDDSNEDLWCTDQDVDWGDSQPHSTHGEDCVPFDEANAKDIAHRSYDHFSHEYTEPGDHVIKMTLKKGDRIIRVLDGVVHISRSGS